MAAITVPLVSQEPEQLARIMSALRDEALADMLDIPPGKLHALARMCMTGKGGITTQRVAGGAIRLLVPDPVWRAHAVKPSAEIYADMLAKKEAERKKAAEEARIARLERSFEENLERIRAAAERQRAETEEQRRRAEIAALENTADGW